ncbi:MAG: hypothetical protein H0X24_01155 [Ktedonobacterales bacterium]|nr:hypothetical protein [Ktedonobacterales bacterium]
MASQRTFFRTVIEIEVLSAVPFDPGSLDEIASDISDGECSGQWTVTKSEKVDGPTMAQLLMAQASSAEFFQLTDDGSDCDED